MRRTATAAIVLFFFALFFGGSEPHPFYLSVTDLEFNMNERRLQGTVKMFTNDFEDALRRTTGKKLDLLRNADTNAVLSEVHKYLYARLALYGGKKKITWHLLGFENEEEATWFYLESGLCDRPGTIRITNTILCDFLPQQMNIVHVRVGDEQKSAKVDCPENTLIFSF